MTQASEWLQSADDHSLAPSTALGKAMDVASHFGPMDAAYEQMLQFLEEGLASADHLYEHGVRNVWKSMAHLAFGGTAT